MVIPSPTAERMRQLVRMWEITVSHPAQSGHQPDIAAGRNPKLNDSYLFFGSQTHPGMSTSIIFRPLASQILHRAHAFLCRDLGEIPVLLF